MQQFSRHWAATGLGIVIVIGIIWAFNHRKVGDADIPNGSIVGLALVAEAREPIGTVTLVRDEKETPVTNQLVLQENDIIRTGADGTVSVEFFAGSRVALDHDTEVRVDTAVVNRTNQRDQRVQVTLLGGRLWSRVLKLLEVDASFTATTANMAASVRGTAFAMTSHPGTAGSARRVDLFDGQLEIDVRDSISGMLESGFTFADGAGYPPEEPFTAHLQPTPDETRNDQWIRDQLIADKAFVDRVQALRQRLGDETSYEDVGGEAGPFTLHEGMEHSSYRSVQIRPGRPILALAPGESLTLDAIADFYENGTLRQDDVTDRARWQLSDTSLATLTDTGVLTAAGSGEGSVTVVARWNDGTHEHSDALQVRIGTVVPPTIETTIDTSAGTSVIR